MTTWNRRRASCRAVSSPMPRLAPVMSTTRCVFPRLMVASPYREHSAVDHPLGGLGVPLPLYHDPGGGALDITEIVRSQLDRDRPDVLLQAVDLRRARDRDDPRLPGQQPGKRHLGGGRVLALRDA